ncbi:hypothetical protein BDR04DRAFT_1120233 [Suillus decipiens]|nr:hypothetical protein BDR04DRAFT_1120233 [Suillus decipiens]
MATHFLPPKRPKLDHSVAKPEPLKVLPNVVVQLTNEHDGITPAMNLPANVASEDLEVLVKTYLPRDWRPRLRTELCKTTKDHARWVPVLALNMDFVLRTRPFDHTGKRPSSEEEDTPQWYHERRTGRGLWTASLGGIVQCDYGFAQVPARSKDATVNVRRAHEIHCVNFAADKVVSGGCDRTVMIPKSSREVESIIISQTPAQANGCVWAWAADSEYEERVGGLGDGGGSDPRTDMMAHKLFCGSTRLFAKESVMNCAGWFWVTGSV